MPSGIRKRKLAKSKVFQIKKQKKIDRTRISNISDPIVKKYWDKKLTVSQNYQQLGLAAHVEKQAGGVEHEKDEDADEGEQDRLGENEARIIRDDDGNVVRVEYGQAETEEEREARLAKKTKAKTKVVEELEAAAASYKPLQMTQTEREKYWMQQLIEKHGDDYEAMKWDKELNIRQQSAGEIKRRILKWKREISK